MIYIATHKKFRDPHLSEYIPIQVGAENREDLGYLRDNTGDNISYKNANFCELTGLYWIWKNTHDKYKGLVHYRRYFGKNNLSSQITDIYSYEELVSMIDTADIIVPYIEVLKQNAKDELLIDCCTLQIFNELERIIKNKYPHYTITFDEYFSQNRTVLFNMMFCKSELFDEYCSWLFDILFDLEQHINIENLNDYQKRLYGFLSERLLNIWIRYNKLNVKNLPVINTEMDSFQKFNLLRRRFTNGIIYTLKNK